MKIAILSTAHVHTRGFLKNITEAADGRQVCAIWDDVSERGQNYAEEFHVPFVPDINPVLRDPQVDGFIICAENTRHLALLEKTLPLGKPVLCEKPLTTSVEEIRKVQALLEKYRAPLLSGYFHFFQGMHQAARAIVAEEGLGKITRVRFRNAHHAAYRRQFDTPALRWFTKPELSGGGAMMDMGTHALHLLISLFGNVESVWAEIGNHSGIYPEVDDYGVAHLRFKNGILGEVEAAWTQTGGHQGLEIVGSEATLFRTGDALFLARAGAEPIPLTPHSSLPDRVNRLVAVHRKEISPEAQTADLRVCIHAVEVMAAIYASAQAGTWVSIAH